MSDWRKDKRLTNFDQVNILTAQNPRLLADPMIRNLLLTIRTLVEILDTPPHDSSLYRYKFLGVDEYGTGDNVEIALNDDYVFTFPRGKLFTLLEFWEVCDRAIDSEKESRP